MAQQTDTGAGPAAQESGSAGAQRSGSAGTGEAAAFSRFTRTECGDLGLSIDRTGQWHYQNSPIRRIELVKLFASVLSRDEDGQHWMTTPIEHGTVRVEDVAFIGVGIETEGAGPQRVVRIRTNLDDVVTLGPEAPLRVVEADADGNPALYVPVRKGLEARLNRAVAYDLMVLALDADDPRPLGVAADTIGFWSSGHYFSLGTAVDGIDGEG